VRSGAIQLMFPPAAMIFPRLTLSFRCPAPEREALRSSLRFCPLRSLSLRTGGSSPLLVCFQFASGALSSVPGLGPGLPVLPRPWANALWLADSVALLFACSFTPKTRFASMVAAWWVGYLLLLDFVRNSFFHSRYPASLSGIGPVTLLVSISFLFGSWSPYLSRVTCFLAILPFFETPALSIISLLKILSLDGLRSHFLRHNIVLNIWRIPVIKYTVLCDRLMCSSL